MESVMQVEISGKAGEIAAQIEYLKALSAYNNRIVPSTRVIVKVPDGYRERCEAINKAFKDGQISHERALRELDDLPPVKTISVEHGLLPDAQLPHDRLEQIISVLEHPPMPPKSARFVERDKEIIRMNEEEGLTAAQMLPHIAKKWPLTERDEPITRKVIQGVLTRHRNKQRKQMRATFTKPVRQ
jgi:hypothetical protein